MLKRMKKLLCCLMLAAVICGGLWTGNTASAAGPAKGPDEGVKDVCVFLPYHGTERDNFGSLIPLGEKVASYTGGETKIYKGAEATVDKLAKAMETCAVVFIGSHGSDGSFGIQNTAGLTDAELKGSHVSSWGEDGGADFWSIDGTIIASHMTQNAPHNFVVMKSCESMKTDFLCGPLLKKGVSAVFGFSESVYNSSEMIEALFQPLCDGKNLAEAFKTMQTELGCWDTIFQEYTLTLAQNSEAAFPIVASEEDPYPGAGKTNIVQTVKSGWLLPVRTDLPQKLILPLGANIGQKTIAYNCKSAKITVGSIPQGVTMSVKSDGTLRLEGTPTKKGYTVATIQIVTTKNHTVTKPVGIMVADEAHATVLPRKDVTFTAGKSIDFPLEFTTKSVTTFALRKRDGFLPYTITYQAESAFGRWCVFSDYKNDTHSQRYTAAPGQYDFTMELITYPSGDVYRRPVRLTINPIQTLTAERSYTASQYDELTSIVDGETVQGYRFGSEFDSSKTSIHSVVITGGRLPKGVHLRCSANYPLGIYGAPEEKGDFTVYCKVVAGTNHYNVTVKLHVNPKTKIPGTAKLQYLGDHPYVGEEVSVKLTNVPAQNEIVWQWSENGIEFYDSKVKEDKFTPSSWYTDNIIGAKVTASGYGGILYSDETTVTKAFKLEGTLCYTSGISVGNKVTTGMTGGLLEIYHQAREKLHFQWQISRYGKGAWKDIPGETKSNYTPVETDAGQYIRLKATADRYMGEVCTTPRQVPKMANNDDPVAPVLQVNGPGYSYIFIANMKAGQEYVITDTFGSPNWSKAMYSPTDGSGNYSAPKDKKIYVYTRIRETDTHLASTKAVYSSIYNGYVTELAGLVLDKTRAATKVGGVTALTVSPLPENFSGWNIDYKLKWFINGEGVWLFANEACSIPITPGVETSYKTVYVKGTAQTSYVQVGVEKQLGQTQIYNAFCSFEVADADGFYIPQYLHFDDVTLAPGETTTVSYTPQPFPAKVGALSFAKTQGESDLTLTDNGDGTVTITAPDSAKTGDYSYNVTISGVKTQYISSVRIIVSDQTAEIIIDGNNQDKHMLPIKVPIGGIYVLPELPEIFTIPRGCTFAGWDKGAVGDIITIDEDTVICAVWKDHTHRMKFVPAVAAACGKAGNPAYYWCEDCEMAFSDELGTQHLNSESIMIPALEHVAGTPVKENVREADASGLGSYETAVYCTVCGEEMTRTYTTVTPAGHELVEVPEKEATCAEEGCQAHWFCQACGRLFADAEGKNEITDLNEICLPALEHAWGEWAVSKPATATEEGEETRVCARCGEQETRKAGEEETTYSFTKGAGGAWTKGSAEGLEFTVTGSPDDANTFARFTGLEMDGNAVAKEAYTAAKGSVIISLKASYLETLPEGAHTLKAVFADGSAEAAFTVSAAAKPVDPTKFDDVAVPSDSFTFRKVWMGDTEKSIDFTLYKADGTVYHHGFDKKVVNNREWRYNAWFSSPAACYVIEKPIPGYQTKYVNVGVYAHVTDRCCDGGTIINKKIPKTGDESNPVLWAGLTLAGIAGLTALVLVKKRGKNGK